MSKFNCALTSERLREVLHYDHDTGVFTWMKPTSNRCKAGEVAGNFTDGYIEIGVDGMTYKAHRLAWLYVYGCWPGKFLDHIDQNKSNNAIKNLREATNAENLQNMTSKSIAKSGLRGVHWNKRKRKWASVLTLKYKNYLLGYFEDKHEAHKAYIEGKLKHHPFSTVSQPGELPK